MSIIYLYPVTELTIISQLIFFTDFSETTHSGQVLNRPLSSRQVKKEKLRHEGLVPVSKGSQAL